VSDVKVIMLGDFNASEYAIYNDNKVIAVKQLIRDLNLNCLDYKDNSGVDYTYKHKTLGYCSYIDHVFVSENAVADVAVLSVIDDGSNLSDHLPVVCTILCTGRITCKTDQLGCESERITAEHNYIVHGSKDVCQLYSCASYKYLSQIPDLDMSCMHSEVTCVDKNCLVCIEAMCDSIVNSLHAVADVIKVKDDYSCKKTGIVWSDELKELKQKSIDIHELWKTIGKPRNGVINTERLRVKFQYKKGIKQQRQKFFDRRKRIMALKLANSNSKDFWRGWRNIQRSVNVESSVLVNHGIHDAKTICNKFKDTFVGNFVNSWQGQLYDTFKQSEVLLTNDFLGTMNTIFCKQDVMLAFKQLKLGKAAGLDKVSAELLINADVILCQKLADLFTACCKHGFVPNNFCGGRISPVPKVGSLSHECADYRPVTTINVIGKVFEYCLLNKLSGLAILDDLQFGFTKGGGCDNAVFIARSVIEYFTKYGSNVYISTLDLTKAFDRVNHCGLLLKLTNLGVPVDIIVLLSYWFKHIFSVVVWDGESSEPFCIKSGIRQGGVCSTWFFNIYINELIVLLRNSGLGCYFFGEFAGCLMYADDVILLSGSVRQLQLMLDICTNYAESNELSFNNLKSYAMVFGKQCNLEQLFCLNVANKSIKWVQSCLYLGVKLVSHKHFLTDVEERKRKFFAAVNNVLTNAYYLSEECLVELIQKQCFPILTYGCGNWCMSFESKRRVSVCYNRAIRRVFRYKDYESVKHIMFGFNMLPMDLYLVKANLCLIGNALRSNRLLLKKCAEWFRNSEECIKTLLKYDIDYRLVKSNIVGKIWSHFTELVNW